MASLLVSCTDIDILFCLVDKCYGYTCKSMHIHGQPELKLYSLILGKVNENEFGQI